MRTHGSSGSGSRAIGQLELCPLVFAWCVCVCCLVVNLIWLLFAHFFFLFAFLFLTVFNCQSWFVWTQLLKVEKWERIESFSWWWPFDDQLFFPVPFRWLILSSEKIFSFCCPFVPVLSHWGVCVHFNVFESCSSFSWIVLFLLLLLRFTPLAKVWRRHCGNGSC